eukprot:6323577-Prymnesium_polylepis.2
MLASVRVIARQLRTSPHFHCGQARRRRDEGRGGRAIWQAYTPAAAMRIYRCGGAGGRRLQTARSPGAQRGLRGGATSVGSRCG